MGDQGNCLADMQGWPPEMQRGGPRCKDHSCFHAFDRHAKRRADMQGWPPEMQRTILHLGQPPLHVGLVLPRTTAERSFCISDSHPCMSALLFCYFTILLLYYFTPATVLPRPMFRVGRPRCTKKIASRAATFACRPCYSTILLCYCFTISLQIQYCRGRCLGLAAPDAKKFCTYYHVLQQNVVFASRTATLACRPSCSTILLLYLFYYFTPDTVLPRPMFRVGRPRCKKTFLHFGQPPLHVGPPILLFY